VSNSLTELNQYSNTSIVYNDDRDYTITFSANAASNTSITINEDESFVVPLGINITNVLSQPGDITYTVDASGHGPVVGTWPSLPNGIIDTSTGNVFSITGTFDQTNWNIAKNLSLLFPDLGNNFSLTANLVYPNTANTQVNNTWSWTNSVTVIANIPEYVFNTTQYRTNNADLVNFEITDTAADGTYTVVIQDVSPSLGNFYYNGAWQSANAITLTGNKASVNASTVWYSPATNYAGNVDFQYSQSKVVTGSPTPIIQANAVPYTLTPFTQYVVPLSYNFTTDATVPVELTQTLESPGNVFIETASYEVTFNQLSPTGNTYLPAWDSSPYNIWTTRLTSSVTNFYGVTWGNNQFVAVGGIPGYGGSPGGIYTSPDGVTWTQRSVPTGTSNLRDVIWANSQYVAVGDVGTVLTSPDGVTWTKRTVASTTYYLRSIAWGNSTYVAVGQTAPGFSNAVILTSSDGITWTYRTAADLNRTKTCVIYANSQFIAVSVFGAYIETSSDGITWTEIYTNITGGTTNNIASLVWNGNYYLAVGNRQQRGKAWKSSDLSTWSSADVSLISCTDVIWADNQFVVSVSVSGPGYIATSPDGVAWTLSDARFASLSSLASDNSKFVAVGAEITTYPYNPSGKIYSIDFVVPAISFTIPANTIAGINSVTSVAVPLNYYRNEDYTGNTISLGYSLAKTRTDAGHPYQNQARTVVGNLAITLTKV
jgi:hypothetical protein